VEAAVPTGQRWATSGLFGACCFPPRSRESSAVREAPGLVPRPRRGVSPRPPGLARIARRSQSELCGLAYVLCRELASEKPTGCRPARSPRVRAGRSFINLPLAALCPQFGLAL
jgi:hypothetical protein